MDIPGGLIETAKGVINGCARIILFFITPTGIFVFTSILLLYLVVKIINSWRAHTLRLKAAGKKTRGAGEIVQKVSILFLETAKLTGRIISNLPVLLSVIIIFLIIVGTAGIFNEFDRFITNEKKIREMRTVLRHLDARYKVADLKITDQDDLSTTMKLFYYDYADTGTRYKTQEVTIRGSDIYIDAIVLNFDYSEISGGSVVNIAIPYRVFSDQVPQAEGIPLELEDENGIPLVFHRSGEEIYGMSEREYTARLKELLSFLTDKEAARKAGVRSIYGNAVHKRVREGDFFSIWIEQTGGLVIKTEEEF
jgi:hypothetical protein